MEALLLAIMIDGAHFKGESAVFLDAGPAIVSTLGVGADKQIYKKGRLSFDFGAFYLYEKNDRMGTNLNFITTIRYRALVYRHISHGAFGIAPDKANAGYNFIGLQFQL